MIQVKTRNQQPLTLDNFHVRGYEIANNDRTVAFLADYFIGYNTATLLESSDQELIKQGLLKYIESLQFQIEEIKELL